MSDQTPRPPAPAPDAAADPVLWCDTVALLGPSADSRAGEATPSPAPDPEFAGLPGYEILEVLRRGGTAIIYKARQLSLKRVVALKMIRTDAPTDPDRRIRFLREAEAVARLAHPNIRQIYEAGEHTGRLYLVLEFVAGGSLDELMRGSPPPPLECVRLAETLARAVHHAHEHGVYHLDLKPGNILLTADRTPKITDFELAALEGSHAYEPGTVAGTPSYMSPEQAAGATDQIGPATDVHGLGAVLYALLTGGPPFAGQTPIDTLEQARTSAPVLPRQLRPKLPAALEAICLKCLEKDPRRRYATARDLAEALASFRHKVYSQGPGGDAVTPTPATEFRDWAGEDFRGLPPREAQALYQSLLETLPLGVFRKDAEGRFTFANRTFRQAMRLRAGDILGRTDFDFLPADMAEKYRADERHVLATGEMVERLEEHLSSSCGPHCRCGVPPATLEPGEAEDGPKYVHVLLAPVRDAAGRVAGIQGAFWNATGRTRAENRLRQTAAELQRANGELARSNADLQAFAYVASHDLQEPLRMVASYTQLLQRRFQGQLGADGDDFIAFAVDGARRMQGLINDLLLYSRVGTQGKPLRPTCCEMVFDKAVANLQVAVAESGAVVTRESLPRVRGDETQLVQLFQNLIGNAIKFRRSAAPRVVVSARFQVSEWLFCVRDNGIGIDPRHAERVFAIFQRLHPHTEYPGNGIGLAVCKRVVERHGGRIWVESEPGVGSDFYFTLRVEWFEAED
jgi:signal transduction histidine kinase/tRNA A-37 threonylcarbamoyl transferase component Bud32